MRRERRWLLFIFALLASGCAHPAGFRPAKTLSEGTVEHGLGLQLSSPITYWDAKAAPTSKLPGAGISPLTPTYALRIGATDWLQLGAQLGFPFLRLEGTAQLVESSFLDLAVGVDLGLGPTPLDPRVGSDFQPNGALPLILGLQPHPTIALVAFGGPAIAGVAGYQVGGGIDLAISAVSFRPHMSFFAPFDAEEVNQTWRQSPSMLLGFDLAIRH